MAAVLHSLPLALLLLEGAHRNTVQRGNLYLLLKHPSQQHLRGVYGQKQELSEPNSTAGLFLLWILRRGDTDAGLP